MLDLSRGLVISLLSLLLEPQLLEHRDCECAFESLPGSGLWALGVGKTPLPLWHRGLLMTSLTQLFHFCELDPVCRLCLEKLPG